MKPTIKSVTKELHDLRSRELELQVQEAVLKRLESRAERCGRDCEELEGQVNLLRQKLAENAARYVHISGYLEMLHGDMRAVLESYYVLGETWSAVAEKLYQSERNIYILRDKAIKQIVDSLNH